MLTAATSVFICSSYKIPIFIDFGWILNFYLSEEGGGGEEVEARWGHFNFIESATLHDTQMIVIFNKEDT